MHNLRGTPRLCHSVYVDVPTNSEGSTLSHTMITEEYGVVLSLESIMEDR